MGHTTSVKILTGSDSCLVKPIRLERKRGIKCYFFGLLSKVPVRHVFRSSDETTLYLQTQ